jgi:hypothetical protein
VKGCSAFSLYGGPPGHNSLPRRHGAYWEMPVSVLVQTGPGRMQTELHVNLDHGKRAECSSPSLSCPPGLIHVPSSLWELQSLLMTGWICIPSCVLSTLCGNQSKTGSWWTNALIKLYCWMYQYNIYIYRSYLHMSLCRIHRDICMTFLPTHKICVSPVFLMFSAPTFPLSLSHLMP